MRDIAIIGGGPAGMMAAGRAGEFEAQTLLVEKNHELGQKLLLTGRGRCNLTTSIKDVSQFVKKIGPKGDFLYSALYKFGVKQTLEFFNKLNVELKEERGKRIFPKSNKASTILNALKDFLGKNGIEIYLNTPIQDIEQEDDHFSFKSGNSTVECKKLIIATGGLSYPSTGSTGCGYKWAAKLGHTIVSPKPALVGTKVREEWISDLEGLSLKNVKIAIYQNDKKQMDRFGEALFTGSGVSGPIVIDMSKDIGKLLQDSNKPLEMRIDFKPALSFPKLDKRLIRELNENGKKMFKNILPSLLPSKIIPTILDLSNIPANKPCHQITSEERNRLLHLLKELTLEIEGLVDIKRAIITDGGIELKEINPQTMESKIVPNLYFAGEIIDIVGPTGGFNLQICWSTGYTAGESAAKSLD
jgi:hypothetical protein